MNLLNDFQVSVFIASFVALTLSTLFCFLILNIYKNLISKSKNQKRLSNLNIAPLGGVGMALSFYCSKATRRS